MPKLPVDGDDAERTDDDRFGLDDIGALELHGLDLQQLAVIQDCLPVEWMFQMQ